MPNYCYNKITINGDKKTIKEIANKLESIKNTDERIFKTLIGEPANITDDNEEDEYVKHYGCKWDVKFDNYVNFEIYEYLIQIDFSTAWGPCIPFCSTLSRLYSVDVKCLYFEPSNDFAGCYSKDRKGQEFELTYGYYEGLYKFDSQEFYEDIDFHIENEIESYPDKTLNDILQDLKFVDEKDIKRITETFNFFKK